jgi:hypothetical protein
MRSLVYIASSLVAYILVWLAAVLRPLDMQLDVVRAHKQGLVLVSPVLLRVVCWCAYG